MTGKQSDNNALAGQSAGLQDGQSHLTGSGRKPVRKAIGPRLRIVFYVLLTLMTIIGANSAYLAGVTALEWWTKKTYQDYFYQWMFLVHIVVGLLVVTPFLVFGIIHMRNTKDRKVRQAIAERFPGAANEDGVDRQALGKAVRAAVNQAGSGCPANGSPSFFMRSNSALTRSATSYFTSSAQCGDIVGVPKVSGRSR